MNRTREIQNQPQIDEYQRLGPVKLGPWSSNIYRSDPRHLLFVLSRYKFVAKLLQGKENILEIGCGDGVGIPIILQTTEYIFAIDIEPIIIDDLKKRYINEPLYRSCSFNVHNIVEKPLPQKFDAAFSLDVLEHIPKNLEKTFVSNIVASLKPRGFLIIGTPNCTAEQYASQYSKEGHINLQSAESIRSLLSNFFHHVFLFSMNDEVVHTGFFPMAHYLFALGIEKREEGEE